MFTGNAATWGMSSPGNIQYLRLASNPLILRLASNKDLYVSTNGKLRLLYDDHDDDDPPNSRTPPNIITLITTQTIHITVLNGVGGISLVGTPRKLKLPALHNISC